MLRALLAFLAATSLAFAAGYQKVVFTAHYTDLADFEQFATRAKASGATHINLNSGLPRSFWEYDEPGDPYPAWVINTPTLLKIAPPAALRKYLPADYAESVLSLLEARGQVLRRLGLKATLTVQDPSMLPEAVFRDHPLWRGARVDHPARSRAARFAPTVDHPEVLALYSESVAVLLRRCPVIDSLAVVTNDSGAGLDWSPGLYSGRFGNTLYRDRSMDDRIRDFLAALQKGGEAANVRLEASIRQTREPDPARIARKLAPGMAIENLEGPAATPYSARAAAKEGFGDVFDPVYGVPQPVAFVRELAALSHRQAPRLGIALGDVKNRDLYFALYDRARVARLDDPADVLVFLKAFAAARYGAEKSADILRLWVAIDDAADYLQLLNTGGYIFSLGTVHQRWLTRPFVPFPGELTDEEKSYFRKFQFQAQTEEYANSLSDVQGTDVYGGWSGRHSVRRVLDAAEVRIERSIRLAQQVGDENLSRRLAVFNCLLRNARGAVSYQAQLDRVKELGIKPLPHTVIDSQSDWDRQLMMETARIELDNTAVLIELLRPAAQEFLVLAGDEPEDITRLGNDIVAQLETKMKIMNRKWEDYKRMFTTPNW